MLGSQVKQFDAKVQAVHLEGFSISGVNPIAQGHVFVEFKINELSHVKHYEILFGSQV